MVKFISYTGSYPSLCMGTLTLEVNGKREVFESGKNDFWTSGGKCYFTNNWSEEHVESGPWIFNDEALPERLKPFATEIFKAFADNVPEGCCGGCI